MLRRNHPLLRSFQLDNIEEFFSCSEDEENNCDDAKSDAGSALSFFTARAGSDVGSVLSGWSASSPRAYTSCQAANPLAAIRVAKRELDLGQPAELDDAGFEQQVDEPLSSPKLSHEPPTVDEEELPAIKRVRSINCNAHLEKGNGSPTIFRTSSLKNKRCARTLSQTATTPFAPTDSLFTTQPLPTDLFSEDIQVRLIAVRESSVTLVLNFHGLLAPMFRFGEMRVSEHSSADMSTRSSPRDDLKPTVVEYDSARDPPTPVKDQTQKNTTKAGPLKFLRSSFKGFFNKGSKVDGWKSGVNRSYDNNQMADHLFHPIHQVVVPPPQQVMVNYISNADDTAHSHSTNVYGSVVDVNIGAAPKAEKPPAASSPSTAEKMEVMAAIMASGPDAAISDEEQDDAAPRQGLNVQVPDVDIPALQLSDSPVMASKTAKLSNPGDLLESAAGEGESCAVEAESVTEEKTLAEGDAVEGCRAAANNAYKTVAQVVRKLVPAYKTSSTTTSLTQSTGALTLPSAAKSAPAAQNTPAANGNAIDAPEGGVIEEMVQLSLTAEEAAPIENLKSSPGMFIFGEDRAVVPNQDAGPSKPSDGGDKAEDISKELPDLSIAGTRKRRADTTQVLAEEAGRTIPKSPMARREPEIQSASVPLLTNVKADIPKPAPTAVQLPAVKPKAKLSFWQALFQGCLKPSAA